MSKNNALFLDDYELTVYVNVIEQTASETVSEAVSIRFRKNEELTLVLSFSNPVDENAKVLLHTNAFSDVFSFRDFSTADKKREYHFSFKQADLKCGKAYYRFAVQNDDVLFWEPAEYHNLLIDPENIDDIVLYTLIPNVSGPVKSWRSHIKHIKRMGFNALHILPITLMGSSESPYSAADLFKIDDSVGTLEDFREFASAAADNGIRLCLDIVLNHISNDNHICRENAQWLMPDKKRLDGMKRAGCIHQDSWISWEDLILLNYDHPDEEIRSLLYQYMLEYVIFWVDISGEKNVILRLDNLHSSNQKFIKWLIDEIKKRYDDIVILSEFFGAEDHIEQSVNEYGLNVITANSWEFPFAPVLENYLAQVHRSRLIRYLLTPTSHDTETAAALFAGAASSVPRYAVCALMGTGITGIVQGFEYGLQEKINFIGRKTNKIDNPLKAAEEKKEYDFCDFISKINRIVHNEECIRQRGNIEFINTGNDSLIFCRRITDSNNFILIAVNLDIYHEHTVEYESEGIENCIGLISEKSGFEIIENESIVRIKLKACGVSVLRKGQ